MGGKTTGGFLKKAPIPPKTFKKIFSRCGVTPRGAFLPRRRKAVPLRSAAPRPALHPHNSAREEVPFAIRERRRAGKSKAPKTKKRQTGRAPGNNRLSPCCRCCGFPSYSRATPLPNRETFFPRAESRDKSRGKKHKFFENCTLFALKVPLPPTPPSKPPGAPNRKFR